jgi:mannose-6-phosphate isomerase-like protein (cupin superfamily)
MNKQAIVNELASLYPGKPIKLVPENAPTEIVCEFEHHPEWSMAVAVIDRGVPHFHRKITEVYHVIKGTLKLHVEQDVFEMYEGQQFTVVPGKIHWAEGNETWVEVYCNPAWSPDDHILAE